MVTVLHVEDDDVFREFLDRKKRRKGIDCDLVAVASAEKALDVLHGEGEFPPEPPDLILLDVGLPMMSGLEFMTELAEESGDGLPPIWILTGSCNKSDIEDAKRLGAGEFYNKDSDLDRCLTDLAEFCDKLKS